MPTLGDSKVLLEQLCKMVTGNVPIIHERRCKHIFNGYMSVDLPRFLAFLQDRSHGIPADLLDASAYRDRSDVLGLQLLQVSPPGVAMMLSTNLKQQLCLYIPQEVWQGEQRMTKQMAAAQNFFSQLPALQPPCIEELSGTVLHTHLAALGGKERGALVKCEYLTQLPSCLGGDVPRISIEQNGKHLIFRAEQNGLLQPALAAETANTDNADTAAAITPDAAVETAVDSSGAQLADEGSSAAESRVSFAGTVAAAAAAEFPAGSPGGITQYAHQLLEAVQLIITGSTVDDLSDVLLSVHESMIVPSSSSSSTSSQPLANQARDHHKGSTCALCNTFIRTGICLVSKVRGFLQVVPDSVLCTTVSMTRQAACTAASLRM